MMQPLKGIRILDFTTLLPGPFATRYLADMGAQVVRVEAPERPDLLKILPPMVPYKDQSVGASYALLNADKDCLSLDLKDPDTQQQIHRMITDFDVVIEGFRPGVMTRLNLGYDQLKALNPRLIYCALTGYGQTGPLRDRAGHDINYLALSGLAGYSGRARPELSAMQIADIAAGSLHAVIGIQAALIDRLNTGNGHFVDIAMADCCTAFHAISGANHLAQGTDPGYGTELLNGGSFYGYYETQDGRWLSVGGLEPKFVSNLCHLIGHPEWVHRFFDTNHQLGLQQDLVSLFIQHSLDHWITLFEGQEVCIEPVLTLSEVQQHPHFKARGLVQHEQFKHPIQYDNLT